MKILIVVRHFPPEISGGARRWLYLSKSLAAHGHDVTVVAPDVGVSYNEDDALTGIRLVRVEHASARRGREASATPNTDTPPPWVGFINWLRTVLLVPDPDIRWAKHLVDVLPDRLNQERFDWIVTSAPPESLNRVGRNLRGSLADRWHADFRDFWLEYPLMEIRKSPRRQRQESAIAHKWLNGADLLTAVDAGVCEEISKLSGKSCVPLPHFVPPAPDIAGEFEFLGPPQSKRLVHTGSFSLSDPDRRIELLLSPFEQVRTAGKVFTLHLLGKLTPEELSLIHSSKFSSDIFVYGTVPLEESLRAQAGADGLALVIANHAPVVPGKFFEYQVWKRPVVLLGDGRSLASLAGLPFGAEALSAFADERLQASGTEAPDLDVVTNVLLALYCGEGTC